MLINGQTKEKVKDFKHIGWGISVRENNNDWAENFPKCNTLNEKKKHSGKTLNDEIQLQLHDVLHSMKTGHVTWRECRILSQRDRNRPDSAHMRYLRNTLGFSRKDQAKEIRKRLGIANRAEEIQSYQTDWTGQVDRMEDCKSPKKLLDYKPTDHCLLRRSRER